jgi:hypothetical protein
MRILFLTHSYPNYVPDLLLHGLRKLLGAEVVDYPRKDCLYEGVLGLGICPPDQRCFGWFPDDESQGIDRDDVWRKLDTGYYESVVCDFRAYATYRDRLNASSIRLVLIDGEDRPVFIPPGPYLICRRETDGADFSIPLPMALPEEIFHRITRYDDEPKRYLIGFLGSTAVDERRQFVDILSSQFEDVLLSTTEIPSNERQSPEGRRSRDEYYRQLQQCRIVLSLPGAGLDTFRFWENSACNAVHYALRMSLMIPADFVEDEHLKRFTDLRHLLQHLRAQAEKGRAVEQEMILANRHHLFKHHLTTNRALYFIDRIYKAFNVSKGGN